MNSEWIIVKNTKHKKNPQLAVAEKIVVLDGSEESFEAFVDELRTSGKVAYKLSSYKKYFNTNKLLREYYQKYSENSKNDEKEKEY